MEMRMQKSYVTCSGLAPERSHNGWTSYEMWAVASPVDRNDNIIPGNPTVVGQAEVRCASREVLATLIQGLTRMLAQLPPEIVVPPSNGNLK